MGRNPKSPAAALSDGADRRDRWRAKYSTYLHLVVNWLEVDVTARFIDRAEVERHVRALPFYRWCYETVIADCQPLAALYEEHGLLPLRPAGDMSQADQQLAALEAEVMM